MPKTDKELTPKRREVPPAASESEDDFDDEPIIMPILQRLWELMVRYRHQLSVIIPLLLIVVVFWMPVSRYAVVGLILKGDLRVVVQDEATHLPISNAIVTVKGRTATTDADGLANFPGLPVGPVEATIERKGYSRAVHLVTVAARSDGAPRPIPMSAEGVQVSLLIVDIETNQRLPGVAVSADGIASVTNDNGETTVILAEGQRSKVFEASASGYKTRQIEVTNTQKVIHNNTFAIEPKK